MCDVIPPSSAPDWCRQQACLVIRRGGRLSPRNRGQLLRRLVQSPSPTCETPLVEVDSDGSTMHMIQRVGKLSADRLPKESKTFTEEGSIIGGLSVAAEALVQERFKGNLSLRLSFKVSLAAIDPEADEELVRALKPFWTSIRTNDESIRALCIKQLHDLCNLAPAQWLEDLPLWSLSLHKACKENRRNLREQVRSIQVLAGLEIQAVHEEYVMPRASRARLHSIRFLEMALVFAPELTDAVLRKKEPPRTELRSAARLFVHLERLCGSGASLDAFVWLLRNLNKLSRDIAAICRLQNSSLEWSPVWRRRMLCPLRRLLRILAVVLVDNSFALPNSYCADDLCTEVIDSWLKEGDLMQPSLLREVLDSLADYCTPPVLAASESAIAQAVQLNQSA